MDREIRIAKIVYAAVTVLFTGAMLLGSLYIPESFYA